MARTPSSSAPGRSLPVALLQTLYLLLGVIAVSILGGVLLAGFFLPAVSATSAVAEDGVDLFESYPTELEVEPLNEASRIEAADGSLLATFYTENRIMVPLEEISPYMQQAVVAVEDRRFYEHGGIDPKGTVRALLSNAAGGATQGGSTLTQQYVKNALLMDAVQRGDQEDQAAATEQTYGRKLREAKLAISLEKQWSKDEILNAYLNVAQFGPSQYGVETGAQHYFSKSAKDLNPGEAALLAGITNGPNQYDPVGRPEAGEKRRNEVLGDMLREGYITQAEYDQYTAQPVEEMLTIKNVRAGCADAKGSGFFCDYVTRTLLNDPEFAPTYEERRKLLYGGGLTIRTTLDPAKQAAAEEILQRRVPGDSESGFGHSIVTVEPGSGKILTMAENRVFNPYQEVGPGETAINYNVPQDLGGSSGFPVGSTFKPFVLLEWLKTGHGLMDRVGTAREPMTTFPAQCLSGGAWREREGYNPDNAVSVRLAPMETVLNATKFSVNTSYANMARQLDLCDIAEGARDIGVVPATYNPYDPTTWDMPIEEMYSTELAPSVVVLGELRISALDMAAAYAVFAADGTYCKPQAITEVVDRTGEAMPITGAACHQAVDKDVADAMAWTLQQDLEDPRATGRGKTIPGHPAGGKTGTSGSQFHTWYVGFTRQMSTAVWFGHPQANIRPQGFAVDGQMLRRGSVWGNTVSLPTWQEYMIRVHEGLPSEALPAQPAMTNTQASQSVQPGTVPDVSGMVLSEAQSALEAAGYTVEVQREASDSVGQWYVIGTDPAPGTSLPEGQTVVIRQSSGRG
ncbi:transglycosylase domain-containing protein [Brachybacterium sp. J144]|uniref:penicillin-binding protein n=1 Tax=Brachybacterium sp. J144 TaxID=3116487 RepID=UPI002E7A063B|nr:transglycosylase domain-containing protein [Brachybacterium sp. J144]MEE1650866.1 transglycosylase domain-containing protein [Brachybacterium sp. J144]